MDFLWFSSLFSDLDLEHVARVDPHDKQKHKHNLQFKEKKNSSLNTVVG